LATFPCGDWGKKEGVWTEIERGSNKHSRLKVKKLGSTSANPAAAAEERVSSVLKVIVENRIKTGVRGATEKEAIFSFDDLVMVDGIRKQDGRSNRAIDAFKGKQGKTLNVKGERGKEEIHYSTFSYEMTPRSRSVARANDRRGDAGRGWGERNKYDVSASGGTGPTPAAGWRKWEKDEEARG